MIEEDIFQLACATAAAATRSVWNDHVFSLRLANTSGQSGRLEWHRHDHLGAGSAWARPDYNVWCVRHWALTLAQQTGRYRVDAYADQAALVVFLNKLDALINATDGYCEGRYPSDCYIKDRSNGQG